MNLLEQAQHFLESKGFLVEGRTEEIKVTDYLDSFQGGVRPHRRRPEHHAPRGHPRLHRAARPAVPTSDDDAGRPARIRRVLVREVGGGEQ